MRVATFGTGYFSPYHYDSWSRIAGVELAGICVQSNLGRARHFASRYGAGAVFTDPAEMLDAVEPDLVDVITTPESHAGLVALASARGIPVICQKPLSSTYAEACSLVEVAERAGTVLVAHENWRFRPWIREIGRLIRAGAVGEPYGITFRMRPGDGQGPSAYLERQPYFQTMPRFLIHETGIHMIDVFRFLLGEVAGCFAHLRRLNPVIAGEDAALVTFSFECGASGLLDGNRLADHAAEDRRLTMGEMLVEGSDGAIRLDGDARIRRRARGGGETEHPYRWTKQGYAGDSVHALQEHVVRHLRDGEPVENTGREYLRSVAVEEAIYRSHEERRWIALADGDQVRN